MRVFSLGGLLVLLGAAAAVAQAPGRLSLSDAVAVALRQNPRVGSAQRSVDAARGRFWRGISPPPMMLTAGYDYIPNGSGIGSYGERSLGLSQSFEFPLNTVFRGSSLSSDIDAALAELSSVSLSVTMQVKLAYFGVLAHQQKLVLSEENLRVAEEFVQKAAARYAVGEGTNLELLTAKVQRTQAANALEVARNDLRVAMSELNLALGNSPAPGNRGDRADTTYVLVDSLSRRPRVAPLDSLIGELRESNPELRSAEFRLNGAAARRSLAWGSALPSFTISYAKQVQGASSDLYGVSLGVSIPLWFLLDQRGQIQEAAAEHARLAWDLSARNNAVRLEVQSAYLEFSNDERELRLYDQDLLPQAEEVHRAAATSYGAGEITYVEYLQARQTVIAVRTAHIDALYKLNAAFARLENAVGRPLGD